MDNCSEMSSCKHHTFPAPPFSLRFWIPEGFLVKDLVSEITHRHSSRPKILQSSWVVFPPAARFHWPSLFNVCFKNPLKLKVMYLKAVGTGHWFKNWLAGLGFKLWSTRFKRSSDWNGRSTRHSNLYSKGNLCREEEEARTLPAFPLDVDKGSLQPPPNNYEK